MILKAYKFYFFTLLVLGLLVPQLAMSQTPANVEYFDGKSYSRGEMYSVKIAMPGLYNPVTGDRSTREDFKQPIEVFKLYDINSPMLADAYYSKTPIKSITIEVPVPSKSKYEPVAYLRYELIDVMISSYSISADGDEHVTLSFSKCEILYKDHDASNKT